MISQKEMDELLDAARAAAVIAGNWQIKHRSGRLYKRKNDGSYSLTADIHSQKIILDELVNRVRVPFAVIAEETDDEKTKKNIVTFVIDPIDGTYNFSRGHADFAVSIGIAFNDKPLAGVIYSPVYKKLYWSVKGKGAWCNNKRIKFSTNYPKQLIAIDGVGKYWPHKISANLDSQISWKKTMSDVVAQAHTAEGLIDGCIIIRPYPWDIAAGIPLMQEAGVHVVDENGKAPTIRSKYLVAGKKPTVASLLQSLKKSI